MADLANSTPVPSRRALLAVAALPAALCSGSGVSLAVAAEPHPDVALLALGAELDVIEKTRRAVFNELRDAEDRTINVEQPEALIATTFDLMDDFPRPAFQHDLRGKTWSPLQIEEIRSSPPRRAYFVPGGSQICERTERRKREILGAYDAYEAERRAADDVSGLTDAVERYEGATSIRDDLARQIIAMPARTMEGLAVKARLRMSLDRTKIEVVPDEVSLANVGRSIFTDLLAMAPTTP